MMKGLKTKSSFKSIEIFDENDKQIGEISHTIISGLKERIIVNNQVFKIRNSGFLWNDNEVYDENNQLIIQTEISKKKITYFGDFTEFFNYDSKGWLNWRAYLYQNEKQVIEINVSQFFFKYKYKIFVDESFKNDLMILFFLNFCLLKYSNN